MKFAPSGVKRILVVTLSNIGDVILTFPVIDILKANFPAAALSVVVGPKGEPLFRNNPLIKKIYVFEKHGRSLEKLSWLGMLRREGFDMAVDLRHTAIPFLIGAKCKTPLHKSHERGLHKRLEHLNRLKTVFDFQGYPEKRFCVPQNPDDERAVSELLKDFSGDGQKFLVISPGAACENKRWTPEGFSYVADRMVEELGDRIVFTGDDADRDIVERVRAGMCHRSLDLSGQTTLTQLAALLKKATLLLANDSGVMHMASYLNIPTVALFGPTDPALYGPWSDRAVVVREHHRCEACLRPHKGAVHDCMHRISPEKVLDEVRKIRSSN